MTDCVGESCVRNCFELSFIDIQLQAPPRLESAGLRQSRIQPIVGRSKFRAESLQLAARSHLVELLASRYGANPGSERQPPAAVYLPPGQRSLRLTTQATASRVSRPGNRMEVREQKFAVKVTCSWSRRLKDSQHPDPKSVWQEAQGLGPHPRA